MSLHMRWFLVIGGLVAVLVLAQSWWVRQLAHDLSREEDRVVTTVGESMAHFFFTGSSRQAQFIAVDPGLFDNGDLDIPLTMTLPHAEPMADGVSEVHVMTFSTPSPEGASTTTVPPGHVRTSVSCRNGECIEKRFTSDGIEERRLAAEEMEAWVEMHGEPSSRLEARQRFHRLGKEAQDAAEHVITNVDTDVRMHVQHEGDRRFLTVLSPGSEHRVALPKSGIRERLDTFMGDVLMGSAGLLAIGLILAGFLAHRVTQPLQRLAASARRVGEGEWGEQVAVQGSGEVADAIVAFNHMSRRLAELDARNQELMARQHLSEIGEISRGLAHSLRNPLNALGLSVDELAAQTSMAKVGVEDEPSANGRRELAEAARRQIRRIDGSIRSFLALASQGGGVVTSVDLGQLADDVALEALQDAHQHVRVQVERQGDDDLTMQAVEPELRAVLQALVVNAVEASPEAGSVTVRLGRRGDSLWLTVDDEGTGLPEGVRQRLFTPHLSTKATGSGMGLFLAHRIATARYGGTLQIDDIPTGGTRVDLTLQGRVETAEDSRRPAESLDLAEITS